MPQFLATQTAGAGQIIPVNVQLDERLARIVRVFHQHAIAAAIFAVARVQGLMHVAHQMREPGQRPGQFGGILAAFQNGREADDLRIDLPAAPPALAVDIHVMPVGMRGHIRETRQGRSIGAGRTKARIVADAVSPGRCLGEQERGIVGPCFFPPAPGIRMPQQQIAHEIAGLRLHPVPGQQGGQTMASGIPGVRRPAQAKKCEKEKQGAHGGIMPRAIIVTMSHATASARLPARLPPASLAHALWQAAGLVARVMAGHSLADNALQRIPAAARPAVQDLVYTTLRAYGRGDFLLTQLLDRPLQQPAVHALLLVALQRLELQPQQAHTIVDQAVMAAGELARGRLRALVNAVLRNFLRQREALLAAAADDPLASGQHPAWWQDRLEQAWPDQAAAILAAGNQPPPMALRVNVQRISRADYLKELQALDIAATAVGTAGIALAQPLPVDRLPGFFDGWVSVQDPGAQRAAEILRPAPGARVLDACAAPGGKTAHLLECAQSGEAALDLLALDLKPARCRRVEENLSRLRLTAQVRAADCSAPADWWDGQPFDAILADVPCTASGVVRRHPDAKWLRRASDIASFARSQQRILDALWPLLRPGGECLYATCSVFPEENQQQIARFLQRHPDAERRHEEQIFPQAAHDGFFYCLLGKRG